MKETIKRAARTFVQAAAGYIVANAALYIGSDFSDMHVVKTVLVGIGVSAVAAGLAAVMNLPAKKDSEESYVGGTD